MLCLTFCDLREGVHIREKVHFVVLCVFSSNTRLSTCLLPPVCHTNYTFCLFNCVINESSRNEID